MVGESAVYRSHVRASPYTDCRRNRGTVVQRYLGTWRYVGSSGGMDGRGLDHARVHRIVIRPDRTIEVFDTADGSSRVVRFDAVFGRTIAGDQAGFLRSGSDVPEVIRLFGDGQAMALADDHVEGITWHFARIP